MANGLDDFNTFIKGYKGVLAATLGGALMALISEFSNITPPFPDGIIQITAVFQLLILIFVYQVIDRKSKRFVDKQVVGGIILFVVSFLIYVFALNFLSYPDPDGERKLKGFFCTEKAEEFFQGACPWIADEAVAQSGGIEGDIWTDLGRDLVGMTVLILWLIMFSAVSFAVAVFANFQRRRKAK
ncbi:hypothetical protein [Algicella marina]|uniref:DUF4199 domain-containing protein n=1 Tax=Algicella marina TaxID=2683284 RepID=A0A6P1SVG9_9RHOB|nr:hypothetical protein [Algicella marina]QHQ34448.1 hypothetical protein GO499_04240 [Algicella marina]